MRKLTNFDIYNSNLYRVRKYRSRVNILAALLFVALVQFFALLLVSLQTESSYYATNSESKLYKMNVYSSPNYKNKALLKDDLPPYSQIKELILP
jgi:hypothetical protein